MIKIQPGLSPGNPGVRAMKTVTRRATDERRGQKAVEQVVERARQVGIDRQMDAARYIDFLRACLAAFALEIETAEAAA